MSCSCESFIVWNGYVRGRGGGGGGVAFNEFWRGFNLTRIEKLQNMTSAYIRISLALHWTSLPSRPGFWWADEMKLNTASACTNDKDEA